MSVYERFRQAGEEGHEFRGAPFWSWNDDLDPEELRRQVREMKAAGLGGSMMHARIGLVTPYLSERWMECIRAAVDESREQGMTAWLYDEDCWPSGTAGGRVPAKGEAFRQKWLVVQEVHPDAFQPVERALAAFVGVRDGDSWSDLRHVPNPEDAGSAGRDRPGSTVLLFTYGVGEYVDLLSREVVADFIREDYEVYEPVVGDEFGKTVPGVFTDEPQWRHVPWSADLPAAYAAQWDEDLLDVLPSVFFPVGDYRQARYRFWSAATRLYVSSFSQQINDWCEGHGLLLTGHQMCEDTLGSQIRSIGAAMPHYEFMGMPGIDHLGRRIADPPLVKQLSSVGEQLGKPTLSEMFGAAGWNVSLEELKWIAEWQFALGVRFVCAHLSLYSLRGCRKRDYPPSLHYQQPWWPEYKRLNDRFARLTAALSEGKRATDLLVLHPIGGAWSAHDPNDSAPVEALNRLFNGISKFLLGIHRDHEYGDEMIMERHGSVEGARLTIGQCDYGTVIMPPTATIQATTAALLRTFREGGGHLIVVGEGPDRLDGAASPEADAFRQWLAEHAVFCPDDDPDALESALFQAGWPRVQVKDENGDHAEAVLVHEREADGQRLFFFANTDHDDGVRADIAVQGAGAVWEWDADTGEATLIPVRQAMGNTAFRLDFEPMQSRLIVLDPATAPWIAAPGRRSDVGIFYGEEEWDLTLLTPNSLTLDTARARVNGGDQSEPTNVLHLQQILAREADAVDLELEFTIENRMSADPGPLHLVMESPEAHTLALNGVPVAMEDTGWWTDISFRKIPLPPLQPGTNTLALTRRFAGDPQAASRANDRAVHESEVNRLKQPCEIEAVYLLGMFGVTATGAPEREANGSSRFHGPFALTDPPRTVATGNLSAQGLPFFCGTVALEQEIWLPERPGEDVLAMLELETLNAAVTKVFVNDAPVATFTWRPYRVDVTESVPEGENLHLRLELTGSCRNLLGPHHHIGGELHVVGPDSFTGRKGWTDPNEGPDSTWKDGYNVVNFGVEGEVLVLFEAPTNEAPTDGVRRQCS